MLSLSDFNSFGGEIERRLLLRTSVAMKLLETEKDIPEGALRPKRDLGFHLGLCQAFAMSRRERKTVAMLKGDTGAIAGHRFRTCGASGFLPARKHFL